MSDSDLQKLGIEMSWDEKTGWDWKVQWRTYANVPESVSQPTLKDALVMLIARAYLELDKEEGKHD